MQVKRSEAIELLLGFKYQTAPKLRPQQMLNSLKIVAEEQEVPELSPECLKLLEELSEAVAAKEEIEIVNDGTKKKTSKKSEKSTTASKSTPSKKSTKGATASSGKKSAKTKPAAEKSAVERDRFGAKVGTQASEINKLIGKKPVTVSEVAEKTGLNKGRVSNHFRYLVERDYAEQATDGGIVATASKT